VNVVMNLWVRDNMWGIAQLPENWLASQEGLCSMELFSYVVS